MKGFIQYIALFFVALASIVAGVIGLVLPVLPGILLIAIGFVLLSILNPAVDRWLHKLTVKHPQLHKMVEELQVIIGRIIGKK